MNDKQISRCPQHLLSGVKAKVLDMQRVTKAVQKGGLQVRQTNWTLGKNTSIVA